MDREVVWSSPDRRRGLRWLAVSILLLAVLGFWGWRAVGGHPASAELWHTAVVGSLSPSATGTGQFVSVKQRLVTSTESAVVGQLLRRPGEHVTEGEPVIRLEHSSLELEREDARQALASAEQEMTAERAASDLESIEARRALAEARFEHASKLADLNAYRALVDKGVVSRLQFERAKAAEELMSSRVDSLLQASAAKRELAQARLARASTRLTQMRDQVRRIESRMKRLSVQAPESGVIKTMLVDLGSAVQPGSALFSIGPESPDLAVLEFPQGYIEALKVGMPVELSYNDRTVPGELVSIGTDLRGGYGTVEARPTEDWPGASIGMVVRATIRIESLTNVVHIPAPARSFDLRKGIEVRRKRGGKTETLMLADVMELDGYLVFPSQVQAGDQVALAPPGE